jgi:hypothetical protein
MKEFFKRNCNIIVAIVFIFLIFIFIDDIVGKSIIGNTQWNSYELQARAWLNGHTYLDHDYPFLELAIYQGKYFVSFPPLPSVILLPFVHLFTNNVPANLISFIVFTMEFVIIYRILKRYKNNELVNIIITIAFTFGTNLISLAIDSGVWFFAQLFNNLFCILAIDAFLKKRKTLVFFFLALAVGCRPFAAIYMIMFFLYYLVTDENKKIYKKILHNLLPLIPAMIVAGLYMTYNYIRFNNILEFGHNYLPEFINAEHGQFSIYYLLPNLKNLFFNFVHIRDNLNLSFDMPFCFLIANPVFIIYIYRSIKNYLKTKKIDLLRLMIAITLIFNIIAICLHRTLGAWQFGARYTCDLIPFVFLGYLLLSDKKKGIKLDKIEIILIIFGVIINIFGAILMYTNRLR